jgi:hypothetical protein
MNIEYGKGSTYGPGVSIKLTGAEVATAIEAYLMAHDIYISGSRTITVNDVLCEAGHVYVDPSGFVISDGGLFSGRGATRPACMCPRFSDGTKIFPQRVCDGCRDDG